MPRIKLTDRGLKGLKAPAAGQVDYWDQLTPGFSVRVSYAGQKTYTVLTRVKDKFDGKPRRYSVAKINQIDGRLVPSLAEARSRAECILKNAALGITPDDREAREALDRQEQQACQQNTYGAVVDQFIEQYAKRRQRTWGQTERALKGSQTEREEGKSIAKWLDRPIASITTREAYDLLESMIAEGHGPKARIALAWLRTLWKWAYKRDIVADPIMEKVEIEVGRTKRAKIFDDDAIKATWRAADKLDPIEAAYVKLLVLLAPRKTALAGMRRSHLDDPDSPTLWTTPPELVKQNLRAEQDDDARVYETPLPALAARIIKSVPKHGEDDLVFPSKTTSGRSISPTRPLTAKLVRAGAPADFEYHAWRHTVATWLQTKGHDKFDRGLILNHAESGVTAGYSHGYALGRKRELLDKWAAHVEELTTEAPADMGKFHNDARVLPLRVRQS